MPTQEEINAANVELQIANDNYAALADRYNNYMTAFQGYADASPEVKAKLQGTMERALADFEQLKLNMYAAEDRINQAQSAINNLNSYVAPQPSKGGGTRRRVIVPEVVSEVIPEPVTIPQEVVVEAPTPGGGGGVNNNSNIQPIRIAAPKTVRQAAAEYNTFTPRFINNNTGTITNPYADFINPNLVTPYTPRPKRRMSGYGWTY